MTQDLVDELDLELVHALQLNPRASWTMLGRALDIDPVTAARRWERLEESGLAWTLAVPGPIARAGLLRMLYIEIECRPGGLDPAIEHLLAQPHVVYLHHLTGSRSLLAAVAVNDLAGASAWNRLTALRRAGTRGRICAAGHLAAVLNRILTSLQARRGAALHPSWTPALGADPHGLVGRGTGWSRWPALPHRLA